MSDLWGQLTREEAERPPSAPRQEVSRRLEATRVTRDRGQPKGHVPGRTDHNLKQQTEQKVDKQTQQKICKQAQRSITEKTEQNIEPQAEKELVAGDTADNGGARRRQRLKRWFLCIMLPVIVVSRGISDWEQRPLLYFCLVTLARFHACPHKVSSVHSSLHVNTVLYAIGPNLTLISTLLPPCKL
jgi:hypothetical protein